MRRREFLTTIGHAGAAATLALTAPAISRAASAAAPRIRIGQFGSGHAHADGKIAALRKSAEYEFIGVVEPNETLRRAAQARPSYEGIRWLTAEELFNTPDLRAVAVETQVKDLLDVAERCVGAGLHIHLDKPAGESLSHFKRVLDTATRKRVAVQMGYMFRYNPGFEFCLRVARDGWLGQLFSVDTMIGKASSADERKKLLPYRGGSMFELGCHVIDSVVALLGPPQKVTAHARHSATTIADGLLDDQLAVLEYPHVLVTVRASHVEVGGNERRQFVVCGDAGTVDIRPLEPPALRLALDRARGEFKKGYQDVKLKNRPRYEADFEDLAKVIRGEKALAWTPAHDFAVQETILQASGLPTA